MSNLPLREIEICGRLRAFREATKIPRSRFAVTLGIGSERLASYESARAPLRYEVFRAITRHFLLNPAWLATGETAARLAAPFDDAEILAQVPPRALFSEVYDRHLEKKLAQLQSQSVESGINAMNRLRADMADKKQRQFLQQNPAAAQRLLAATEQLIRQLEEIRKFNAGAQPGGRKPKGKK